MTSPRALALGGLALAGFAAAFAGCGKREPSTAPAPEASPGPAPIAAAAAAPAPSALPPAPPVPALPVGLPALPAPPSATAETLALGAELFRDARLSADDKVACTTCHDPRADYAGGREPTSLGRPNLRRAPSLSNLAWQRALGWDGRFPELGAHLSAHFYGQLGLPLDEAIAKVGADPRLVAHFARAFAEPPSQARALEALVAFASTRYSGGAPWDLEERRAEPSAEGRVLRAGYALFLGKARCAQCHPPPLYTDLDYHRLGVIATADEGRGLIERERRGAFKTPSLRGAAARKRFFHDGSVTQLRAAIEWHLGGGTAGGADRSIIDPALVPVALSPDELEQLLAFVTALTPMSPAP